VRRRRREGCGQQRRKQGLAEAHGFLPLSVALKLSDNLTNS
jgi:hypothetical protein